MKKIIFIVIKKIILAVFLVYAFNLLVSGLKIFIPINVIIPINFVTVLSISLLGFPALFSYIIIYIIFF